MANELRAIAVEFVVEIAYSEMHQRLGFEVKARPIIAVAALAAICHVRKKLRDSIHATPFAGWNETEIVEVLVPLAQYAGIPAVRNDLKAPAPFSKLWRGLVAEWPQTCSKNRRCELLPSDQAERAAISESTGRRNSRNCAGFSLIGKWPSSGMMVRRAPGIDWAVRRVSSGVHEKSYSPVRR